jgi:hypothetical protein
MLTAMAEPDPRQRRVGTPQPLGPADSGIGQRERDIVDRGDARQQCRQLEHKADVAAAD